MLPADIIPRNSHENTLSTDVNHHARPLKSSETSVLLKIVPVIETCVLCDEASTITIIDKEIVNVLGCVGEKEPLTMKWTNDTIKKENGSIKVSVRIKGKQKNEQFTIRNARTMKRL
ncbi:hypothetical protein JTB14_005547 [Gonioctena quinquepunctata]|nr:hypothetical protein JTB14_005547 [Gonioctena quinquepunctata]